MADWNGPEAAEFRSGRADSKDEAGSAVRHDEVGGTALTDTLCSRVRWRVLLLDSLQKDYKKQMLMAAHALAVDAKNLLDVIDQSRLKMITHTRPH